MKPLYLAAILLMIGCGNQNEKNAEPADYAGEYNVKVISADEIKEIVDNRNGKNLFINVWATWCAPCVEEFPDLVKLFRDYNKEEIEFIALSVDLPSDIDSAVIPFMKNHKVPFPVYIIDERYSEEAIELLSSKWSGAIPASFIYDDNGEQKEFILGAHDYLFFKKKIDSVLNL